jgi:hypothetical protein
MNGALLNPPCVYSDCPAEANIPDTEFLALGSLEKVVQLPRREGTTLRTLDLVRGGVATNQKEVAQLKDHECDPSLDSGMYSSEEARADVHAAFRC